ncbi:MAG: methyltransferase [Eubacteriales bacterium]|nr:methyltransferase [Eubacteriales bacterium]
MRQTDKLWGGFALIQDDRFFKLGQDSMLLSAFAAPPSRAKIMDLGCGNGALGVLLCARHAGVTVTGLEIQPEVAALAQENVELNGLQQRMTVIQGDLKQHKGLFATGSFDYVVCNPPYFSQNSGFSAKGHNRLTARQEAECNAADAIQAAAYLVKFGGRAAFVYRPERMVELIADMRKYQLEPKRLRFVHQHAQAVPSAVLIEARRGSAPGVQVLPPLLVCDMDGTQTAEYRAIYHQEEF